MKNKIFNLFKKYILFFAHKKYPNIRKRKYSLEYYLDNFYLMLNDLCRWESLKLIHKDANKYHYKTIYNEYNRWSNDNIFIDAFSAFVNENYFKISKLRKNKKITLFIDVTKINNLYGSDYVYMNNEYCKKNVTPLTVISDQYGLPLAFRHIDHSKYFGMRKSHVHELKNTQKTLNKITLKVKDYVDVSLTGDKAYISNETYDALSKKIKLIAPKRKNQKTKNTKKEKDLMSKRYIIEHLNGNIKKYNRIYVRKDRTFKNYSSFMCIIFLLKYFVHIEKLNDNKLIKYLEKNIYNKE